MQKVYVELVFLDNFLINLLIILLASRLTRTKIRWGRCALSAALGGLYACAVFGTDGAAVSVFVKVAVSLAMCTVAFWARGEKGLLKNICAFYVTSFVFAGAIYACTFCFGSPAVQGGAMVVPPLFRYILLGFGVGAALLGVFSRVRRRVQQQEQHCADMVLEYGPRRVCAKAYIDTGNMATEPLSGLGVLFVSLAVAETLFDRDTLDLLLGRGVSSTDRLRIVPCTTAAGQSVFYGIQIDNVSLKDGQTGIKAVVCVAQSTLAGGCGAIAGHTVVEELRKGAQNEKVVGAKDRCMGADPPEGRGKRGLYQRQRGASAAADAAGRNDAASVAGGGGQVGSTHAH